MALVRHREYETIYILRPNADEATRALVKERVEGIIGRAEGHLLKFDDWGIRRLAYRIHDPAEQEIYHEQGVYQYYRFIVPPSFVDSDNERVDAIGEIERNLSMLDPVIKFLSVKIDDELDPEERLARPVEEKKEIIISIHDDEYDDDDDDEDDD